MDNQNIIMKLWRLIVRLAVIFVFVYLILKVSEPHINILPSENSSFENNSLMTNVVSPVLGGVIGAVAASAGIIYTDKEREKRNRLHTRRSTHYNSLVALQRHMDKIRLELENNMQFLQVIINSNDAGEITLYRASEIPLRESYFDDLYDIDLINLLNDVHTEISRLNTDYNNLNVRLDTLADRLYSNFINISSYNRESRATNPTISRVISSSRSLIDDQILHLLAYVGVCLQRDATPSMKSDYEMVSRRHRPITEEDIETERINLLSEINR